jgi:hypothetical protein
VAQYNLQEELSKLQDGEISASQWKKRIGDGVQSHYWAGLKLDLAHSVKCCEQVRVEEMGAPRDYMRLPSRLASFYFNLRAGSLALEIETGRYHQKERAERVCRLCLNKEVEDLHHFCLSCPALEPERRTLVDSVSQAFPAAETLQLDHLLGKPVSGVAKEQQGNLQSIIVGGLHTMWARRCALIHSEHHIPLPPLPENKRALGVSQSPPPPAPAAAPVHSETAKGQSGIPLRRSPRLNALDA